MCVCVFESIRNISHTEMSQNIGNSKQADYKQLNTTLNTTAR